MHITYGWTVMGDEDEMVNTGSQGVADFAAASEPGKWLVNLIPLCEYRTLQFFRRSYETQFTSTIRSPLGSWSIFPPYSRWLE